MSLNLLLDPDTVATLMTTWPVAPSVHHLPGGSPLSQVISPEILYDYLDTGCIPPSEVNIIRTLLPATRARS